MRLVGFLVLLALMALTTASVGSSRPLTFRSRVGVGMNGWGSVKPGRGFQSHSAVLCRGQGALPGWCGGGRFVANAQQVSLTATPYKGWRFAGWRPASRRTLAAGWQRGSCAAGMTKPKCVIDLSRVHPDKFHQRKVWLRATFIPVTPGLTRANPVPMGHSANIGGGFQLHINSATPRAQLTPAAPAGTEYFLANITATYTGGGSSPYLLALLNGIAVAGHGHHDGSYGVYANPRYGPCPNTPPPAFPTPPIDSGQSVTGNVCWTVPTYDQSTLELFIDYPFASHWTCGRVLCDRYWTWFAFH